MPAHLKRKSWLDSYKNLPILPGLSQQQTRDYAFLLDDLLYEQWQLGNNLLLAWAPLESGMLLLRIHHYDLVELESEHLDTVDLLTAIMSGRKLCTPHQLREVAQLFNTDPIALSLPFTPGEALDNDFISEMVKRYGITLVHDRAVALIDAVGFSLFSGIQQVTQLNSLSYSVNSAYGKLLSKAIDISFARSTTGDGFYLWNRATGLKANLELFQFLMLILADNAIAQGKARNDSVPRLRACFHIGSHYEFYQEEALSPTRLSYLVGDVTIDLARMIEKTLPGQVLVGDFRVAMHDVGAGTHHEVDTIAFIQRSRERTDDLDDIELSGDTVSSIQCYLTGPQREADHYAIERYQIIDKHGLRHGVYNAKINIHRRHGEPIYLGIPNAEMHAFSALEHSVVEPEVS